MSLLPIVLRELTRDFARTSRAMNRHFEQHFFEPFQIPTITWCREPLYRRTTDTKEGVTMDKNKFEISLDVQQFTPTEITVKTVDNNSIVVEGKHDEKHDDYGTVSRQFIRRYSVPDGHDIQNVVSTISSDGILTVTAPRVEAETTERIIPVTPTGPARVENSKEEKKSKD